MMLVYCPRAIFKYLSGRNDMNNISTFLKEVRVEMAKVSWPTRKQTVLYTLVVIGLSLFLAVFLGLLDVGFEFGLNRLLIR